MKDYRLAPALSVVYFEYTSMHSMLHIFTDMGVGIRIEWLGQGKF